MLIEISFGDLTYGALTDIVGIIIDQKLDKNPRASLEEVVDHVLKFLKPASSIDGKHLSLLAKYLLHYLAGRLGLLGEQTIALKVGEHTCTYTSTFKD